MTDSYVFIPGKIKTLGIHSKQVPELRCFVCGEYKNRSARYVMKASVANKESGKRIARMYKRLTLEALPVVEKKGPMAAEPVKVKVGACYDHIQNLEKLRNITFLDDRITPQAIKASLITTREFNASVTETYLVDRTQDDVPSTHMIYFAECNKQPWKDSEISFMEVEFAKSKLLRNGQVGTIVSFPDVYKGYSFMLDFKRDKLIRQGPLLIRNIDMKVKADLSKEGKERYSVEEDNIDPILCSTVLRNIFDFSQHTLLERGIEAFRKETYSQTEFERKDAPTFEVDVLEELKREH